MIDYHYLHNSLLKMAGYNSDLVWSSIGQAFCGLNTELSEGEQVVYLRRSAIGFILNHYNRDRLKPVSELAHQNAMYGSGDDHNGQIDVVTLLTAVTDDATEAAITREYTADLCGTEAQAMRLVLDAIFDGYFQRAMTPETVRKLLQSKKMPGNLAQISRTIVAHITRGRP